MRNADRLAFGASGLDRAAALRRDAGGIARLLATGRVLPVWRGRPLLEAADRLGWVPAGHAVLAGAVPAVFLGIEADGAYFAADVSHWAPEASAEAAQASVFDPAFQSHPALPGHIGFADLRGVMLGLSACEAELAATAKALVQWHRSHRFCPACGAASEPAEGGWQRRCPACAAQHFPRTDPVVIMLVTRGNRALFGRSPGWPEGMYSCLAGFIEPGESVEAAVRREVQEETGVAVGRVRYLASQPWPFPASLMLGCHAEALSDTITPDPAEIEDALWISREEMVAVQAGTHPRLKPPRRGAIAHVLVANWLAGTLEWDHSRPG